jgi:hypothetical protein
MCGTLQQGGEDELRDQGEVVSFAGEREIEEEREREESGGRSEDDDDNEDEEEVILASRLCLSRARCCCFLCFSQMVRCDAARFSHPSTVHWRDERTVESAEVVAHSSPAVCVSSP